MCFLNWYDFLCILWICPIIGFLVWLTLRAIAVCPLMFFVFITFTFCSVSIKLSWVSVDCQRYLKLNGVIQYLIWISTSILTFGWRFSSQQCLQSSNKDSLKIIQSGQGTVGWWLGEMLIKPKEKQDFNPLLSSACHLKLPLFPPCAHT